MFFPTIAQNFPGITSSILKARSLSDSSFSFGAPNGCILIAFECDTPGRNVRNLHFFPEPDSLTSMLMYQQNLYSLNNYRRYHGCRVTSLLNSMSWWKLNVAESSSITCIIGLIQHVMYRCVNRSLIVTFNSFESETSFNNCARLKFLRPWNIGVNFSVNVGTVLDSLKFYAKLG